MKTNPQKESQKEDEDISKSDEQIFNQKMLSFFHELTSKYPDETINEKVAKKTKIYFDDSDQHIVYDKWSDYDLVEFYMEEKCFVVSKNSNNEIKVFTKKDQDYSDEIEFSIEQKHQILTHLNSLIGGGNSKNHPSKRPLTEEQKSDSEEPLNKKQKEPSKEENFDQEMLLFFLHLTSNYLDPVLKEAKTAKSMIEFSNNSIAYNKTEKLELILFELTNESPPQFHSAIKYNNNRIELYDPNSKIISDQQEKDRILSHLNSLINSEKTQFSLQQDSKEGEFEKDENQYRNIDLKKLKQAFIEKINSSQISSPIENDGLTLFILQQENENGNFQQNIEIFNNNCQEITDQNLIKAIFNFAKKLGLELSAKDPNLQCKIDDSNLAGYNPENELKDLEISFFGELPMQNATKSGNIYKFSFKRYDIEYIFNEDENEKHITRIFDKQVSNDVALDIDKLREIIYETLLELGCDKSVIYEVLGFSRSESDASMKSLDSVEFAEEEHAGFPSPKIVLNNKNQGLNLKRKSPSP